MSVGREAIIADYLAGMPLNEIAAKHGFSSGKPYVCRLLRTWRIAPRRKPCARKTMLDHAGSEIAAAAEADRDATVSSIAQQFGVCETLAGQALRMHGIDANERSKQRRRRLGEQRCATMAAMLAKGIPAKLVAAEFGITRNCVYSLMHKFGHSCRPANRKRKRELAERIRSMRAQGLRYADIAEQLHYSTCYMRELGGGRLVR